jgi:hypothetical protein
MGKAAEPEPALLGVGSLAGFGAGASLRAGLGAASIRVELELE